MPPPAINTCLFMCELCPCRHPWRPGPDYSSRTPLKKIKECSESSETCAHPPGIEAHQDPKNGHLATHQTAIKDRSEEHTSELQSQSNLVCRLLLEKKKNKSRKHTSELATHSNLGCRLLLASRRNRHLLTVKDIREHIYAITRYTTHIP